MEQKEYQVQVHWGRQWLDLTKVSPEIFQSYLITYGLPKHFEVSGEEGDFKYEWNKEG